MATKTAEAEPLPTDLLTPKEVAARFRLSRETVYDACRNSLLRHYRLQSDPGRRGKLLIREADVRDWLGRCVREVDTVAETEKAKWL